MFIRTVFSPSKLKNQNEFNISQFISSLPLISLGNIKKDKDFFSTFNRFSPLIEIWNSLSQSSK